MHQDLDPAYMVPLRFEFRPKDARVNLRLSKGLLQAIKARELIDVRVNWCQTPI